MMNDVANLHGTQNDFERFSIRAEAEYYLTGTTTDRRSGKQKPVGIRDVAATFHKSVPTIHDDLVNKLYSLDRELFAKVSEKLEENRAKTITDPNIMNRVMEVYHMYVDHNMYIPDIAKYLHEEISTVYNDLTIRLPRMHELYPSIVSEVMVENVKNNKERNSANNLNKNSSSNMVTSGDVISIYMQTVSKYTGVEVSTIYNLYKTNERLSDSEELTKDEINDYIKVHNKLIRISFCVEVFLGSGGLLTDKQISALIGMAHDQCKFIPSISSSSVQRYLTDPSIIEIYNGDVAEDISTKRKENLQKAKVKGGVKSSSINTAIIDENGKFNGSKSIIRDEHKDLAQLLEREAHLFIGGMTIEEIAKRMSIEFGRPVDYFDVRRGLMQKLKKFNTALSEEVDKHFRETEPEMQEKKKKEMLTIYDMYVNKNMTIEEIANVFHINKSNISRRLGSGLKALMLQFPNEITKEMIDKVAAKKEENERNKERTPSPEETPKPVITPYSEEVIEMLLSDEDDTVFDGGSTGMGHR